MPFTKRKLHILAVVIVFGTLVLGTMVILFLRRSALAAERDIFVNQPLADVKNGSNHVSIAHADLLRALAADPECIDHLTDVTFTSMELSRDLQEPLARLKNLETVGFYSCRKVDEVVPVCSSMSLTHVWFETSPVSPEALATLSTSSSLRKVSFDQDLSAEHVAVLKRFPATIKIDSLSFPLDLRD